MKYLLASTAAAVAFVVAPAFAQPSAAPIPQPQTSVTVETQVTETPSATVETKTETVTPVSTRPAVDPDNPIAPEVRAVVAAKKNYTTADIVKAQYEAMLATPASAPTTVVTTTTTTPKAPG
jgi:hypothetical protein